eukprot:Skav209126  [mRNA]  locus=scaffold682:79498:85267:+ [translate_table: standard]
MLRCQETLAKAFSEVRAARWDDRMVAASGDQQRASIGDQLSIVLLQDNFELPSTHRLSVRPWHASAFEKLPRLQNQKQHRWRLQQRRRHRQAKELRGRQERRGRREAVHGSVVRAWRMKLDPENRSTMDELSLRKYCSKALG